MLSGGKLPEGPVAPCEVSVGFIQVCRNSLRSYEKSWKSLGKESYLKSIFNSGIAFYVFPGCPTIDMVVPLRITKGTTTEHIPMFVSIKCRAYVSDKAMIEACKKMKSLRLSYSATTRMNVVSVFGWEERRMHSRLCDTTTYGLFKEYVLHRYRDSESRPIYMSTRYGTH